MKEKDEVKESTKIITSSDSLPSTVLDKPLVNRIMQLFCTGQYNRREIAHILKITPTTVSKWLAVPEVSKAINEYQREETIVVDQAIKAIRMKAVDKMDELLDAENEMVQWQAARDILDRTGHKADNKTTVNVNVRTYEERLGDLIQDVEYTEEGKNES